MERLSAIGHASPGHDDLAGGRKQRLPAAEDVGQGRVGQDEVGVAPGAERRVPEIVDHPRARLAALVGAEAEDPAVGQEGAVEPHDRPHDRLAEGALEVGVGPARDRCRRGEDGALELVHRLPEAGRRDAGAEPVVDRGGRRGAARQILGRPWRTVGRSGRTGCEHAKGQRSHDDVSRSHHQLLARRTPDASPSRRALARTRTLGVEPRLSRCAGRCFLVELTSHQPKQPIKPDLNIGLMEYVPLTTLSCYAFAGDAMVVRSLAAYFG
jgi:hypothetical protein